MEFFRYSILGFASFTSKDRRAYGEVKIVIHDYPFFEYFDCLSVLMIIHIIRPNCIINYLIGLTGFFLKIDKKITIYI